MLILTSRVEYTNNFWIILLVFDAISKSTDSSPRGSRNWPIFCSLVNDSSARVSRPVPPIVFSFIYSILRRYASFTLCIFSVKGSKILAIFSGISSQMY